MGTLWAGLASPVGAGPREVEVEALRKAVGDLPASLPRLGPWHAEGVHIADFWGHWSRVCLDYSEWLLGLPPGLGTGDTSHSQAA